jgi:hypothetical protein
MSPHQFLPIYKIFVLAQYALWVGARVRGCVRRWQQPLLRGPEWFFNVRVQPCLYSGPGAKILRDYRMRIFVSVAIEVPLAAAIFISGHFVYVIWLILAMGAFVHIFHAFSVDWAECQARKFAVAEAEQPVASVALSLKRRSLGDYSNVRLEVAMALSSLVAFAWLVHYYLAAPEHHNLRLVFGGPIFLLYTQAGFLFAKQVVVAWRTPVPQIQADEHLEAREAMRKLYLKICDMCRVMNSVTLLFFPFWLSVSPARQGRLFVIFWGVWLAVGVVITVWQEIKRKKLLTVTLRADPVKLPDLMGHSDSPSWPLCYKPSSPMLVLKGARGYSLNLANTLAPLGAAYLCGWAVIVVLLGIGH